MGSRFRGESFSSPGKGKSRKETDRGCMVDAQEARIPAGVVLPAFVLHGDRAHCRGGISATAGTQPSSSAWPAGNHASIPENE